VPRPAATSRRPGPPPERRQLPKHAPTRSSADLSCSLSGGGPSSSPCARSPRWSCTSGGTTWCSSTTTTSTAVQLSCRTSSTRLLHPRRVSRSPTTARYPPRRFESVQMHVFVVHAWVITAEDLVDVDILLFFFVSGTTMLNLV
jgi:hypothetical protein